VGEAFLIVLLVLIVVLAVSQAILDLLAEHLHELGDSAGLLLVLVRIGPELLGQAELELFVVVADVPFPDLYLGASLTPYTDLAVGAESDLLILEGSNLERGVGCQLRAYCDVRTGWRSCWKSS